MNFITDFSESLFNLAKSFYRSNRSLFISIIFKWLRWGLCTYRITFSLLLSHIFLKVWLVLFWVDRSTGVIISISGEVFLIVATVIDVFGLTDHLLDDGATVTQGRALIAIGYRLKDFYSLLAKCPSH